MGERRRHYHQQHSRMGGLKGGGGEIVEVEGGHIVRAIGRKDRHSKVCTAKGARDRRVRLSAHTAIQFYDVQDRLGYDRPSKAVDWLIHNAKAAIDELAELPPWLPTSSSNPPQQVQELQEAAAAAAAGISNKPVLMAEPVISSSSAYCYGGSNSFLPLSLDSDSIADTIKSFFPVAAGSSSSSPSIAFQNYPPDLLSRTSSQGQDLRLSLQSFQDPTLLQSHHHSSPPLPFEATSASWSDQSHRTIQWSAAETNGYVFNWPTTPQAGLGQSQFYTQRGPLQSSNSSSIQAWTDPTTSTDHHRPMHQPMASLSAIGFASGSFSGFHIPARIQGEEEEHDGISNKPSSASRH